MKKVYLNRIALVATFAFFFVAVGFAQNVGVNTDNPTNSLHVKAQLPTNDPVRFETLQPAMVGDTAVLVCDPISGVVRQMPINTLFNSTQEWVFDPVSGYIYARRAKTEGFDIVVTNDGQIGIRTNNPTEALEVNGKTKTTNFQMTNGAVNNYVMKSDASGNGAWAPINSVFTDTDDQQITTFSINPTTNVLTLTLESGGTQTVNLTPYLDNTDNQQITNFSLNPTTNILTLTLQNGGTQTVNLSSYVNTDTDDQTLSISGQNLSISEGNTVVLPDKDQQSLSISGQSLSISGGNTVTLPQSIDHDFYEVGTTTPPDNINDNKFTMGNIGIGINNPTERLHVQGNQYLTGAFQKYILGTTASSWRVVNNDGAGNFNIYLNSTSGATNNYESDGPAFRSYLQSIGTNNNTNRYRFMYATPGTAGGAITWNDGWTLSPSTGNFGIGTSNPTTRLDVNGKTRTTEFQMTTGAVNNYIMKSDASGNGSWVAANTIFTDTDTDNQQLTTFSINPTTNILTLTLEDGGTQTVNLTPYLDNTDNQQITNFSLNPTTNILTLSLQNGGTQTVNLSSYINTDTDDQTLSISGQNLSISEGNTVVLPDKDQQTLSISGQSLSISGGNTITLPQNVDHDWYEVGTTTPPDNINDNIFTMGNVGINTNSPVTRLTVNNDITNDGSFSYSESEVVVFDPTANGGDTPNGTNDVLTLAREGMAGQALGNRASLALGRYEDNNTNSRSQMDIKLQHGTFATAATTVMSLQSVGNVGIGTTTPAARLHVSGGNARITSTSPQIQFDDTDGNSYWIQNNGNKMYFTWDENNDGTWDSPHPLYLDGRSSYFDGSQLTVRGDLDMVGVGLSTPTSRLDVNGTLTARAGNPGNTYTNNQILFGNNGSANYRHAIKTRHNTVNSIDFYVWNAGVDTTAGIGTRHVMSVTGTGNGRVGIGTTAPLAELHVIGNIYATGNSSDRRFKKHIQPYAKDALAEVAKISAFTYEYDREQFPAEKFPEGLQTGFIAQQLEEIVPEAVFDRADGYKGVDYGKVTPLLVEAVKQLKLEVEALKVENAQLQQEAANYDAMSAQLESLTKHVEFLMGQNASKHTATGATGMIRTDK